MSQALRLRNAKQFNPVASIRSCRPGRVAHRVYLRQPVTVRSAQLQAYRQRNGVAVEEHEPESNGFFTDAFKAALATAVSRQSQDESREEYTSNGNGWSQNDAPYKPAAKVQEEVSASEEVLLAALQQCQANLATFTYMARQLEAVIDREKRQVERLQFALEKCRMDNAYYRTLEALAEERRGGRR